MSIERKLLTLLFLSIALVLLLVGISFSMLIHRFHEQKASDQFERLFQQVGQEIALRVDRLQKNVDEVTRRDDVVSSINIISRYADPEAYQPLVFDNEKQLLGAELRKQVRAGSIGQMALYDDDSRLAAFYRDADPRITGYLSYESGRPVIYVDDAEGWVRREVPDSVVAMQERWEAGSTRFRRCPRGFVIEAGAPVVRAYPDGSARTIGHATGGEFVREGFVAQIRRLGGVDFALMFADGSSIGEIPAVSVAHLGEVALLDLEGKGVYTHVDHDDYFLGAARLPLAGGETAYLVAGLRKSVLASEMGQSQRLVLLILFLSAAIIIPTGAIAARRRIAEPVDRLAATVEAIRQGDYSRKVDASGNDELSRLAEAFNEMAEDIARRERALGESEAKYRTLVENLPQRIFYKDRDSRYVSCNRLYAADLGTTPEAIVGRGDADLFPARHAEEYRKGDLAVLESGQIVEFEESFPKGGEEIIIHTVKSPLRDEQGEIVGILGIFWDVTERKRAEERLCRSQAQLDHLAHHDPLTDLPNRALFVARLNKAIERSKSCREGIAVLFLDLDRFKNVNDTLGHPVGDLLLQSVARRLNERVRETDTVARLGGDEFVVMVERLGAGAEARAEAALVAQKLLSVFADPFVIGMNDLHLGASIGISLYPEDGEEVDSLVKHADAAMYLAKEQGRNTFRFYTTELSMEAEKRFHLEGALRHAVERGELTLHYQPQVDLGTGRIVAAEALLRWNHPELGLVTPDRFTPLAEETGLILSIGGWVLTAACRQFVEWRRSGLALERVSVNLSGVQIERGDVVRSVREAIAATGIEPRSLELEITETAIMKHPDHACEVLDGLRGLGVELTIDDFGTGYSSLGYLKRFPLMNLKIDKSFVRDVPGDPNDEAIVRAVIALAENLQLRVTAEGVETPQQRRFLVEQGCDGGQGFLYGRPLPPEEFQRLCRAAQEPRPLAVN